jgi:hypothetical protein
MASGQTFIISGGHEIAKMPENSGVKAILARFARE